jgi:hypothetical protein
MSAIFDFSSLLTVLLLLICTTTYLRELRPSIFDGSVIQNNNNKDVSDLVRRYRSVFVCCMLGMNKSEASKQWQAKTVDCL